MSVATRSSALSVRFGPEVVEVGGLREANFASVHGVAKRLVELAAPISRTAVAAGAVVGVRGRAASRLIVATTEATFRALMRLVTPPAVLDAVVLHLVDGALRQFDFGDVRRDGSWRVQLLACARCGAPSPDSAGGAVAIDVESPPSRAVLRERTYRALHGAGPSEVPPHARILAQPTGAARGPAVPIDDDDDVLVLVDDILSDGPDAFTLLLSLGAGDGAPPQANTRPAPPQRREPPVPAQPSARATTPPPVPMKGRAAAPRESRGRFLSIRFEFNPPAVAVVGDMQESTRDALADAILSECVGSARVAACKTRPGFVKQKNNLGIEYYELRLASLFFDENQQTMLLLCVLDVMSEIRNWKMVPCDGEVHIEETLYEHDNRERAIALRPSCKRDAPVKAFKQAFELLFIWHP